MNRADCRAMAVQLYFASTGKHDVDDRQWNLVLDTYNKKIWREAAAGIGSMLALDSADLSTDSTGGFTYAAGAAGIDPAGVHFPIAVELKFQGRYIHLDYEIPQDRYIYNLAFGQVQVLIPSAYTLLGERIVMLPRVSGAQVFRITYVPRVGDWTLDATECLRGFLPDWHNLVVYEAVAVMAGGSPDRPLVKVKDELRSQWKEYIQSRQRQDGRKVRFVPYE